MAKNSRPDKTEEKPSEKKNVKIGKAQHQKVKIEATLTGKTVEKVLNDLIDKHIKVRQL